MTGQPPTGPAVVAIPVVRPTGIDHSSLSGSLSVRPRGTHGLSSVTWNSGGVAAALSTSHGMLSLHDGAVKRRDDLIVHIGHESSFSIDPQKFRKLEARMVRVELCSVTKS